ncbi:PEP-CTERM sorting domain-containing protein [Duganella callida]|uniref:PEP-CTERM sorting domain-containing protein n=1 Tax=Duganella callida TaxID=2561932 RepID=A0A4Y9STY5_9BURK|nr:PEP-CTERM sorting domain-containing protein [Duganella callida]TFW30160.1 PEP-CTERM sorting domain-containing protein [Duganella callida]
MLAAVFAATAIGGAVHAEDLTKTITLKDIPGNTYLGYDGNTIVDVYLGANAHLNTMSWDVTLTANPGSLLSLAFMAISDSQVNNQLYFLPANIADPEGGYHAGTEHYTGSVDFRAVDEPGWGVVDLSFSVNKDGILRLEFAENLDELPGADAVWNSAKLTFGYTIAAVPEPATYGMMLLGLGVVGAMARKRRHTA